MPNTRQFISFFPGQTYPVLYSMKIVKTTRGFAEWQVTKGTPDPGLTYNH